MCFELIDTDRLKNVDNLILLFEILEANGVNLSFLAYSQYRFRHLNQIDDIYSKFKLMKRGKYDIDVDIKSANNFLFLRRLESDDSFYICKAEYSKKEDAPTISQYIYSNLDDKVIQTESNKHHIKQLTPEEEMKLKFGFKVIRTPISSRIFVIGGYTNKHIREIIVEDPKKGPPILKSLYSKYTVIMPEELDIFSRTSTLFKLRTGKFIYYLNLDVEGDDKDQKKKVLMFLEELQHIKGVKVAKFVEKMMKNREFRIRLEEAANSFKTNAKLENISDSAKEFRDKLLNASSYIIKHAEGVTEALINIKFSDEGLVNFI